MNRTILNPIGSVHKTLSKLSFSVGQAIDSFNHVKVYYNGRVSNVNGRHLAADGYNLGLKYQCVEFVKRYYYEYLHHKIPDSYGHAKDFFNRGVGDGKLNTQRNLLQFTNTSSHKPAISDLIVFGPTRGNPYGHVAIISKITSTEIEIIQQNPGPFAGSRDYFPYYKKLGKWEIDNKNTLGRLRKKE